jgi:DNA-binding SARP family transcriptional activator
MSATRNAHDPGLSSRGLVQPLHIRLLGGFGLSTQGGGGLALSGSRQRALLAYLLLHRDRPVDRRHLAFLLWPESAEAQALTNLRQLLHDVRAAIPDADRFIEAGRQLVRWREEAPFVLDVDRFESGLSSITQQGPTHSSIASLIEGIALYTGDLLPKCYDEWVEPTRRRLRDLLVAALRRAVSLLDENAKCAVMRLHAAQGRRAQALDTYARTETLLQEELGTAPMPALRELRDRLLRAPQSEERSRAVGTAEPAFVDRAGEWRHSLPVRLRHRD